MENTHAHPPPSHHATLRVARSPPTTNVVVGVARAVVVAIVDRILLTIARVAALAIAAVVAAVVAARVVVVVASHPRRPSDVNSRTARALALALARVPISRPIVVVAARRHAARVAAAVVVVVAVVVIATPRVVVVSDRASARSRAIDDDALEPSAASAR